MALVGAGQCRVGMQERGQGNSGRGRGASCCMLSPQAREVVKQARFLGWLWREERFPYCLFKGQQRGAGVSRTKRRHVKVTTCCPLVVELATWLLSLVCFF